MNNKRILSIIMLMMLIFTNATAQNTSIILTAQDDTLSTIGGRTQILQPTAAIGGSVLTISFPESTSAQVQIMAECLHGNVFFERFNASTLITIDLAEEDLDDGTYTLRVYAFGKWWIGEFELEDSSME